jgi:hypothetical protein
MSVQSISDLSFLLGLELLNMLPAEVKDRDVLQRFRTFMRCICFNQFIRDEVND